MAKIFDDTIPVMPPLLEALFLDSPIKIIPNVQGNKITDDGHLAFGFRSGPVMDLDALIHEMCHLVEIDDSRCDKYGWALTYGTPVEVLGTIYHEPQTTQATERELRVFAYQNHLRRYLGMPQKIDYDAYIMRLMPDFFLIQVSGNDHESKEKKRIKWCSDKIKENMKTLTLEKFFIEWNRKNKILRKKLTKK